MAPSTEEIESIFKLHCNTSNLLCGSLCISLLRSLNLNVRPDTLLIGDSLTLSDFKELIGGLEEKNLISEKDLFAAFKNFDTDGNGFVDIALFKDILPQGEIEELGRYMNLTDGQLDYEKFIKLLY